jgi:hypothetical protein
MKTKIRKMIKCRSKSKIRTKDVSRNNGPVVLSCPFENGSWTPQKGEGA